MEVDNAVMRMYNPSLTTELHHFWCASSHKWALEWHIDCLKGELFTIGMQQAACICHLQVANAKEWNEKKRDKEANVHIVLPWEHMKDTLHINDLDDSLWSIHPEKGVMLW